MYSDPSGAAYAVDKALMDASETTKWRREKRLVMASMMILLAVDKDLGFVKCKKTQRTIKDVRESNSRGPAWRKIEKKNLNLYVFRDHGDNANRYFEYSINFSMLSRKL